LPPQRTVSSQGLPGYTFERAPGGSWRSRLDAERNVIVINNGHRDFVYASRSKSLKLRYLVRLYAKELVMHNFVGLPADQLLERMVELSLCRRARLLHEGEYRGVARRLAAGLRIATATIFAPATA
jgi:hypothetical protein